MALDAPPSKSDSGSPPARVARDRTREYVMTSRGLTERSYRRILILLVALVVVPTFLTLALGLVMLLWEGVAQRIPVRVAVLSLSGAASTGVVLVWVFVSREANLSQLQSDFVSKVSHELRTPLTSIRLFSETLALRRGDTAAEDKCIAGLARESARLQELIDRLLDWGRMESGRREYTMRQTDVYAIVDGAVDAFEPTRQRRGADLSVELPPDLPPIEADRAAMSDALVNILVNAYKYGGEPVRITLSVTTDGRKVRIAVRDNGQGIEAAEHQRIFQKFYRVDDRLSRDKEGSGLGLAIVKHVMRAHRGRVELESAPGQGSTFTLVVPAVRTRAAATEHVTEAEA